MPRHWCARSLRVRHLRRDYLPALWPFLANQRHPDLPRFWPANSVDDSHQDAGITKDSHICFARRRARKPAGTRAFRDDVLFAQQPAVEGAADEIIGDDPA